MYTGQSKCGWPGKVMADHSLCLLNDFVVSGRKPIMDDFLPVSPISQSFDPMMLSPLGNPMPTEFTERSGSYLTSIMNDELPPTMVHGEVSLKLNCSRTITE
jgi:hypothetical protein